MMRYPLFFPLLMLFSSCQQPSDSDTHFFELWVGTYTKKEGHVDGKAQGIGRFLVNGQGALSGFSLIADQVINPSYIQLSADGNWLFAASETGPEVDSTGYIYAYRQNDAGEWIYQNRQSSHAFAPCYVNVYDGGEYVLAANYVGGTVCSYRYGERGLEPAVSIIRLEGGSAHPRQDGSHPHAAVFGPGGEYAYVPDLGANVIWVFRFDAQTGELQLLEEATVPVSPEAGPRHLVFHPEGNYAYLSNELNNTVSVFALSEDGFNLELLQELSTLPAGYAEESYVADLHLTPDGGHLYVSNRGHNSLAHFRVGKDGLLTTGGHTPVGGDFPRNFVIHPEGKSLYVANQNSDNIVHFSLDPVSGTLDMVAEYATPTPVCLQFRRIP